MKEIQQEESCFSKFLNLDFSNHIYWHPRSSRHVEELESHSCLRQSLYCSLSLLGNVIQILFFVNVSLHNHV